MKPSSSNQMSEQFQSVLPAPVENSFQIIGSQPNPNHHNSDPFPASTPNPNLGLPDSLSIPRKRKRGRVTRKPSSLVFHNPAFPPFSLLNGNNFNGNNELVSYSSSSSSSANVKPLPTAVVENSTASQAPSVAPDISEEIIFINKEATAEALIALSAGFPADSLTDEEIEAGVVSVIGGIEQVNYILIRNHILARWRENVTNWLTKESLSGAIPQHCDTLLNSAYNYLLSHGYINFGVAPTIKEKIPAAATKPNVIVIGAGLAGLAAARQLMAFGFKVIILEGRKRAGGRVYTKKMEGSNRSAAAELGGSVLTGTLGNPLGILAKQLSYPMHKVRDKCPLYSPDGKPVDPDIDSKVETAFNRLLDHASKLRQLMGEVSVDVSLGAALDIFQEVYGDTVNAEEMNLFHWHLANLEYANAGLLSKLSFAFWDQDDPYDMGGDHCFLPGGNGRLVQALVENLNILYEKTVHTIRYGSEGVQVVAGPQVFEGDMALCTVPLGVLKNGSIKFIPELPQRKLDGIKRLGFGLLNKVAMLFPHVFWGNDLDTFGHLSEDPSRRGEFFLFYSYATVAGGPVLIALVAGEAALKFESMAPTDAVTRVLQILKGIYEPQGIDVPEPIQTVCTRWGSDPFSLGSYSNVAVGASGDDYDILAENVGDGRLFFAGEATTRRYPATMHGAFLSGLREAASMANHANARSLQIKIERSPSKDAQSCASLLADLFREPDLEFGSFAVIFGPISDIKSMAIMRVMFSGPRKKNNEGSKPDQQHSNKLLFQQLQSHFNQQQQLHVYTLLSTQQVLELREVRGGDEARLNYLSEKLGVKLVGRRGLGSAADSVIAAIKAERGNRRPPSTSRALKSGTPKQKASSSKLALVRRAKVVTGSSNSARPPARPPLPALVRMPAPAPAPSQATAIASSPSTAMAIVSVPAPAPSLSLAPAPARPPVPTPARMPAPAQSTAPVLAPFQATAVASASSMATAPAPVLSRSPALALTQPPVPISALSPALAPSQMEAPALASAPAPAPSQATTTALSPAPSLATAPALSRAPSLASSLALSQALPLTLSPAPSPSVATAPALSQASSPNPVPSSFPIPSHGLRPVPIPGHGLRPVSIPSHGLRPIPIPGHGSGPRTSSSSGSNSSSSFHSSSPVPGFGFGPTSGFGISSSST